MAVLEATPSTLESVKSRAGALDEIKLLAGTYPGSAFTNKSNITYKAFDWYEDRALLECAQVGQSQGQNYGVRITGPMNIGASNVKLYGPFHDTIDYTGINAGVISGHNVQMFDPVTRHRPRSGARQIGYTLGTCSVKITGFKAIGGYCLSAGKIGDSHDHEWYVKYAEAPLIEDWILEDAGEYPVHCYPRAINGRFNRLLIVRAGEGCVAFSGDLGAYDSSICLHGGSEGNGVTGSILMKPNKSSDVLEAWAPGPGNFASGNFHEGNIANPKVATSNNTKGTPQFVDAAKKDWRIPAGAPNVGFGPKQLQPGYKPGTPPPPPAPLPDEIPPSLSITSPIPGQVVKGQLAYSAESLDEGGVKSVSFYVRPFGTQDRFTVAEDTTAPYSGSVDSSQVADGEYLLEVVAEDQAGNKTTKTVNFLVDNVIDPPPPDPEPEPPTDEELHDLWRGDFQAIANRLEGVEGWKNLTEFQIDSVGDARRRALIGLGRFPAE